MRANAALVFLALLIACGPTRAAPQPQPADATPLTAAARRDLATADTDVPDFDRTCHQMIDPYVLLLKEKRSRGGDVPTDEAIEAEVDDEIEECIDRMRTLYAADRRDFTFLADCLAKATGVDAVERCRSTPRPLTQEEEFERQTLIGLAETARHLAYYVGYHDRCPIGIADLVGEGMATETPKDPWGNPLELQCEHALDGSRELQVVISRGPDGKAGTPDDYSRANDEPQH